MIHQIEMPANIFNDEVHKNIFRNFRRTCYENEPELHFFQGNKCWKIINNFLRGTARNENPLTRNKRMIFQAVIKTVEPKYIRKRDKK